MRNMLLSGLFLTLCLSVNSGIAEEEVSFGFRSRQGTFREYQARVNVGGTKLVVKQDNRGMYVEVGRNKTRQNLTADHTILLTLDGVSYATLAQVKRNSVQTENLRSVSNDGESSSNLEKVCYDRFQQPYLNNFCGYNYAVPVTYYPHYYPVQRNFYVRNFSYTRINTFRYNGFYGGRCAPTVCRVRRFFPRRRCYIY